MHEAEAFSIPTEGFEQGPSAYDLKTSAKGILLAMEEVQREEGNHVPLKDDTKRLGSDRNL